MTHDPTCRRQPRQATLWRARPAAGQPGEDQARRDRARRAGRDAEAERTDAAGNGVPDCPSDAHDVVGASGDNASQWAHSRVYYRAWCGEGVVSSRIAIKGQQ